MYDTYAQRIYEWLRETFYPSYQGLIADVSSIVTLVKYGLYIGVFAFLFWVAYKWISPYLFKG